MSPPIQILYFTRNAFILLPFCLLQRVSIYPVDARAVVCSVLSHTAAVCLRRCSGFPFLLVPDHSRSFSTSVREIRRTARISIRTVSIAIRRQMKKVMR